MEEQNNIEDAILNLSNKNITDDANVFKEIISSYPNVQNLNLSDNQLTYIPSDLSLLKKLKFLDIQRNPFSDFNKLVEALTSLPNLINLNINLKDKDEVELIFQKLPNLEVLNEKKIKEQLNEEENNNINNNINNNMNNNINIERNNSYENSANDENENMENNDNVNLIDINDDEIKNISLQDDIPNFNNIYKKIFLKNSNRYKKIMTLKTSFKL